MIFSVSVVVRPSSTNTVSVSAFADRPKSSSNPNTPPAIAASDSPQVVTRSD